MFRKMLSYFALPLLLLLSNSTGNSAPLPAQATPEGFNQGPDIITGDIGELGGLEQFGAKREPGWPGREHDLLQYRKRAGEFFCDAGDTTILSFRTISIE